MNKVIEFLKENPVQYLATVGRNGKAKCRPFMFSGEMDGKMSISICRAIRLSKDSMRLRTIQFLRYFTWMSRMV